MSIKNSFVEMAKEETSAAIDRLEDYVSVLEEIGEIGSDNERRLAAHLIGTVRETMQELLNNNRPYYILLQRDDPNVEWGIDFGDFVRKNVAEERDDVLETMVAEGICGRRFHHRYLRIVKCRSSKQADIDKMVAELNERIKDVNNRGTRVPDGDGKSNAPNEKA